MKSNQENNIQTKSRKNIESIIIFLKMFFDSSEEPNFETLNEQKEKYCNEDKDMLKKMNNIENENEDTDAEKSKPNESTDCTQKIKQSKSKQKLKRKVNSKRKILKRCLKRRIIKRKKRKKISNQYSNNLKKIELKKNKINLNEEPIILTKHVINLNEEPIVNSQRDAENKNIKVSSKIREEHKKFEDIKEDKKIENNPNSNDAMSVSSLGKNDIIQNDNQNEDNIINTTINNVGNLSISSEQNQNNNQNNSLQHSISEDNSLDDNNAQTNQNQGTFLYQDNQENDGGDDPVPNGDMTFSQTYEVDSFNNQGFVFNYGINTFQETVFENQEDLNSMIDYLNHYENEKEDINSEDINNLQHLESNHKRT